MIRIQFEIRGGSERNRRPHEVWCISNYSAIPLTLSGGVNQFTWSRVPRENSMTSPQAIPVVMNIMTTVNVTRKHAIAWDMGSTEKTCINYAGTLSWNANNYNSVVSSRFSQVTSFIAIAQLNFIKESTSYIHNTVLGISNTTFT